MLAQVADLPLPVAVLVRERDKPDEEHFATLVAAMKRGAQVRRWPAP